MPIQCGLQTRSKCDGMEKIELENQAWDGNTVAEMLFLLQTFSLLASPQKVLEDCKLHSCSAIVTLTGVIHGNSHLAAQTHVCYILGAVASPFRFWR